MERLSFLTTLYNITHIDKKSMFRLPQDIPFRNYHHSCPTVHFFHRDPICYLYCAITLITLELNQNLLFSIRFNKRFLLTRYNAFSCLPVKLSSHQSFSRVGLRPGRAISFQTIGHPNFTSLNCFDIESDGCQDFGKAADELCKLLTSLYIGKHYCILKLELFNECCWKLSFRKPTFSLFLQCYYLYSLSIL